MRRTLTAFGLGALAGYAYAFVSCLIAGKGIGRKQPEHPPGTHAADCPWDDYFGGPHPLDGEDMHDVLPTNDEPDYPCKAPSAGGYLCTEPVGHEGAHLAQDNEDEVCDVWSDPAASS